MTGINSALQPVRQNSHCCEHGKQFINYISNWIKKFPGPLWKQHRSFWVTRNKINKCLWKFLPTEASKKHLLLLIPPLGPSSATDKPLNAHFFSPYISSFREFLYGRVSHWLAVIKPPLQTVWAAVVACCGLGAYSLPMFPESVGLIRGWEKKSLRLIDNG